MNETYQIILNAPKMTLLTDTDFTRAIAELNEGDHKEYETIAQACVDEFDREMQKAHA